MTVVDRMTAAWRALRTKDAPRGERKGFQPLYSTAIGNLPGTSYDYVTEAGATWKNSIVAASAHWAGRAMTEAPIGVHRHNPKEDQWQEIPDHALTALLKKPNSYYAGRVMLQGLVLSLMVDGNAYLLKRRAASGRVAELWYIPHFQVSPMTAQGEPYISYYKLMFGMQSITVAPTEIVHFRDGLDPEDRRKGLSPLASALREICTDNERSTYDASILRNLGIPGMVIRPKDATVQWSPDTAKALKESWKDRFTGDRRGEPLALTDAMDITPLAFSPQQMALTTMAKLPEERISALLGIPAIVVGFGAGLDRATFANYKEARSAAYESAIVPLQGILAEDLSLQLLPDFGQATNERVEFDNSKVTALQENQTDIATRMNIGVAGGWVMVSEAREAIGLPFDENGDKIYLRAFNVVPTTAQGSFPEVPVEPPAKADTRTNGKPAEVV
jgi:HK97 family phage portal protein